ncbi:hypothetical protein NDU88_005687 [Pleurodeles waltl]|uniref:Secreted protein n=1 Tax=Pleurodeles waltl TaxID=8319 RepID=A0AAV7VKL0_PLEWA|nr:hypothetical protein NDU88_005687 [Pleurodeles waltl]
MHARSFQVRKSALLVPLLFPLLLRSSKVEEARERVARAALLRLRTQLHARVARPTLLRLLHATPRSSAHAAFCALEPLKGSRRYQKTEAGPKSKTAKKE